MSAAASCSHSFKGVSSTVIVLSLSDRGLPPGAYLRGVHHGQGFDCSSSHFCIRLIAADGMCQYWRATRFVVGTMDLARKRVTRVKTSRLLHVLSARLAHRLHRIMCDSITQFLTVSLSNQDTQQGSSCAGVWSGSSRWQTERQLLQHESEKGRSYARSCLHSRRTCRRTCSMGKRISSRCALDSSYPRECSQAALHPSPHLSLSFQGV